MPAYMTMDAGPNVKVLCRASDMERLIAAISAYFPAEKMIPSLPGPAASVLTEAEWTASQQAFARGRKA